MGSSRVWVVPGIAGALAFWAVNLAISLTTVAADYRAALKALFVSVTALVAVTAMIELPGKLLRPVGDPWHNLLIATLFNALRIAALGLVIGTLRLRPGRDRTSGHRTSSGCGGAGFRRRSSRSTS